MKAEIAKLKREISFAKKNRDKFEREGAEIAYTNVINSVRREFKNLLQPEECINKQPEKQIVFAADKVQQLIQMIYSEFTESMMKPSGYLLRDVIEREVEQHPLKPLKIFN